MKRELASLAGAGFDRDGKLELASPDPRLAKPYEESNIAFRYYPANELPEDAELEADLAAMLRSYDEYLASRNAWLFQANPRYYDISRAVRELDEMNWTVAQYQNQIAAGDRVYIWQSGSDGGVIAMGRILTDPEEMPDQEGETYIVDPKKFEGDQLRVRLSIDQVLASPLSPAGLKEHPVLNGLPIFSFANATNFELTPEQDKALLAMIAGGAQPKMTLEDRIQQWREEIGYPTDRDVERREQREMLEEALSKAHLDAVIDDPEKFDLLKFGQLAHNAYGGPGPQSIVHKHLNTGPEVKQRLAYALRHLIYDEDESDESRLNDVLLKDDWRVPGLGESLATKSLAVMYPDRWLPLFQTEGSMGKRTLMKSPELSIVEPEDVDGMTVGEKIAWSNDAIRAVLDPYFPDDPWGEGQFLYWLRDLHAEEKAEKLAAGPARGRALRLAGVARRGGRAAGGEAASDLPRPPWYRENLCRPATCPSFR